MVYNFSPNSLEADGAECEIQASLSYTRVGYVDSASCSPQKKDKRLRHSGGRDSQLQ